MTYEVELQNVYKAFGNLVATNFVTIGIQPGRLVGILGPSGGGKTTILRMIAGLEMPDSGDIYIHGRKVTQMAPGERGIGFVFQNYALFCHMTVYDNIAFGMKVQGCSRRDIERTVPELIERVGLGAFAKQYPMKLSGGQRQRVAFARALAPRPRVLLLDEPFAAIDAAVRKELRLWLRSIISELGITAIFVTHDQYEAVEVADDIIIMNRGQVEQMGSATEIYQAPATAFVASFIGESTRIEDMSRFKGFAKEKWRGQSALVRPEFIDIGLDDTEIDYPLSCEIGTVQDVCFRGSTIEITLQVKGALIIAQRSPEARPVRVGDRMYVFIHRMCAIGGTVQMVEHAGKSVTDTVII